MRIGCVKYLNARPLIHGLDGNVVLDHPSALCAQLARGELDVALVSSFEFLRNPIYKIVDQIAIASDGPVYSVVVAHRGRVSELEEIELDPAAQTSGNLLRCLLGEMNLNPRFVEKSRPLPTSGRLLIGDQAIRFRQEHADKFRFFDLGERWRRIVGLPFVYALWLVRPEVGAPKSIADRLRSVRDKNLANIDELITEKKEFGPAFCDRYYREHLRFEFGEREKKGLLAFHGLCQRHELLPKRDLALSLV